MEDTLKSFTLYPYLLISLFSFYLGWNFKMRSRSYHIRNSLEKDLERSGDINGLP